MTASSGKPGTVSIESLLQSVEWHPLEIHLNDITFRIDESVTKAQEMRGKYREELLESNPELQSKIQRPSTGALEKAKKLLTTGTVAASDGTISPVPLLGGTKIQVGVVIVSNTGEVVNLVTRVFETELIDDSKNATEFFSKLRGARKISNLLGRAIMLFGERQELLKQKADWRMIHGELIPHELRTGAGNPAKNLNGTFQLVNQYVESKNFIAVSEGSDDIDIINAAILLEQGEYIVIRNLQDTLNTFLEGDQETGQAAANFAAPDKERFRAFIASVGPQVSVVLVKAGSKPFLLECHSERVEDAVALFLADSLWSRGLEADGSSFAVRGFPFHIDLADQVARTLLKGSDFRALVESRLFSLGVESGLFDLDARRTR